MSSNNLFGAKFTFKMLLSVGDLSGYIIVQGNASVFIVNRVIKMSFLVTVSQVQECLLFLSNRLETREIFENFFQFVVHVGSKK